MDFKNLNTASVSILVAIGGIVVACLNEMGNWRPEMTMAIIIGSCILWGCGLIAIAIHGEHDK